MFNKKLLHWWINIWGNFCYVRTSICLNFTWPQIYPCFKQNLNFGFRKLARLSAANDYKPLIYFFFEKKNACEIFLFLLYQTYKFSFIYLQKTVLMIFLSFLSSYVSCFYLHEFHPPPPTPPPHLGNLDLLLSVNSHFHHSPL